MSILRGIAVALRAEVSVPGADTSKLAAGVACRSGLKLIGTRLLSSRADGLAVDITISICLKTRDGRLLLDVPVGYSAPTIDHLPTERSSGSRQHSCIGNSRTPERRRRRQKQGR